MQIIKYGNILLGVHFNLRYSKLRSDYYKVIRSAYVMGVAQNHFYRTLKEITQRKNNIFGKINLLLNSGDLVENNDVKHNIFRCLIPQIWMILDVRKFYKCSRKVEMS